MAGNYFAAISICLCLYGAGIVDYHSKGGVHESFGLAIIWIGAVFQMFLSVSKVSALVYSPFSEELLNASVMMGPVGNYVAAWAFAKCTCYYCYLFG